MTNDIINDNRRTQLSELNIRTRTYATQLWQVPFAYLALIGVLLTQLNNNMLIFGLFFISVLGISVLVHMFFVVHFHNKTVLRIIDLEKEMHLCVASSPKPGGTVAPFMALVFIGVLSPIIFFFRSHPICLIYVIYLTPIPFGVFAYLVSNCLSSKSIIENDDERNQKHEK